MTRASVLAMLPLLLLTGCFVTLTSSRDVVYRQSDEQRLIVVNTTPQPLSLGGSPPVTVQPGKTLAIPFRVTTIGTLKPPSATPYWTVEDYGFRERFDELDNPGRVDANSSALALRFRDTNGRPVTASFMLDCASHPWSKASSGGQDHELEVPDPVPGVPQEICP